MNEITISAITTQSTNPNSKLKKDSNGYYRVILGALNVHNSAGAFYAYTDRVASLFKGRGSFYTRLQQGYLKSEVGHPKFLPGMTTRDYLARNCRLEETNICGHIKEVTLKPTDMYDGNSKDKVVLITGLIKPMGPMADALERDLDNGDSNTAFSIRSLTIDRQVAGKTIKELDTIITWDFVNVPGLKIANKHNATNLSIESEDLMSIRKEDLLSSNVKDDLVKLSNVSNESDSGMLNDVIDSITRCTNGACLVDHWSK